jgi:subtilisin family serine protease
MRNIILIALIVAAQNVFAQQDTLKFRVSLKDKLATKYSLTRPEEFLSQKAIERRKRQSLPIDSTDLPVCVDYIKAVKKCGVRVLVTGKWDNFVTVSCNNPKKMDKVAALPCVKSIEQVWQSPGGAEFASKRDSVVKDTMMTDNFYGRAFRQIEISRGDKLHEAGFRGEGMTIAVVDAGFHNVDKIETMKNINIIGTRDFVDPNHDIFSEDSHGEGVLSCMAMNTPHLMVGTAPAASYWLLRSEDARSENLVEQDYWAAAVEFADSVGVDVINSSLGYYSFDDKSKNYQLRNLDGQFALISRQASKIADKGMILVCSAGNSGAGPWKKVTPPGDADNVLTVGAIDKDLNLAHFSSIGNTADGRIKPDVVAMGKESNIMGTNGCMRTANGTSFASPTMCGMVACLWQALPELTAKEIIELVRRSSDRAEYPDNIYGYGVPDMWKAYESAKR